MSEKKLGLIVNPVAGLGGRVGLKGSDGLEVQRRALALGARPQAGQRAAQALEQLRALRALRTDIELVTCPGEMGEQAARAAGLEPVVLGGTGPRRVTLMTTTAEDTRQAARDMLRLGVDLLLFAGGDGTARDVCQAVGQAQTVLGIPAGVKIHSGVYATSPAGAGELAALYLEGRSTAVHEAEVLDVDEEALRRGTVSTRLYGYLRVPVHRRLVQGRKAPSPPAEAAAMAAIGAAVVARMQPGSLYVLGPGTTMRAVADCLGVPKTLVGVDAVLDGCLVAADANEARLLELLQHRRAFVVVTPIGGQGYVLGRGNQQLSPAVIRAAGTANLIVAGTPAKIHALQGRPLLVDSGDPELDRLLSGHVRVITGYGEEIVYRLCG